MEANLSYGQRIDANGLIQPWYTHGALDKIQTWNLSDKVVLEYGGGASTAWWASKAKKVYTIETNHEWIDKIGTHENVQVFLRECREGDQSKAEFFTALPDGLTSPDIVIVDSVLRFECIQKAITLPRPLKLIVDNWQQDYVFICPAAEELLKEFRMEKYVQADHTEHEGRPWTTAIFDLPKEIPIDLPTEWQITSDWDSHRPILYFLIHTTNPNIFLEVGIGEGSTLLLAKYFNQFELDDKFFTSFESNREWVGRIANESYTTNLEGSVQNKNHNITYLEDYNDFGFAICDILFIDSSPGEQRKELIIKHAPQSGIIVVHDTETGADYVYGLAETLSSFKFRCDFIVPGKPSTTVISNIHDVSMWAGVSIGGGKII